MSNKSVGENSPVSEEANSKDASNAQAKKLLSWDEYKHHMDMHKFYIELGLKANVFFFAIVGAILSVLYHTVTLKDGNIQSAITTLPRPVVALFLKIPFFISLIFAVTFLIGAGWWRKGAMDINKKVSSKETDVPILVPQKIQLLTGLLIVFALIFFIIAKYLLDIMKANNVSIC
jgi:uncharacterized protein with PQ loop repeat